MSQLSIASPVRLQGTPRQLEQRYLAAHTALLISHLIQQIVYATQTQLPLSRVSRRGLLQLSGEDSEIMFELRPDSVSYCPVSPKASAFSPMLWAVSRFSQ